MRSSLHSWRARALPAGARHGGPPLRPADLASAPQLAEIERQRANRPASFHERHRHDRLAGPAGEVIDVQRHRRREEDDLRWERRHLIPRPQPQRQPQMGEDARTRKAALGTDEIGGARMCGESSGRPRAAEPSSLDRRRELARAAVNSPRSHPRAAASGSMRPSAPCHRRGAAPGTPAAACPPRPSSRSSAARPATSRPWACIDKQVFAGEPERDPSLAAEFRVSYAMPEH